MTTWKYKAILRMMLWSQTFIFGHVEDELLFTCVLFYLALFFITHTEKHVYAIVSKLYNSPLEQLSASLIS